MEALAGTSGACVSQTTVLDTGRIDKTGYKNSFSVVNPTFSPSVHCFDPVLHLLKIQTYWFALFSFLLLLLLLLFCMSRADADGQARSLLGGQAGEEKSSEPEAGMQVTDA